MSHYHVDDDFSQAWSIDDNLDWFIINYFCEPVDNNKY